MYKWLFFRGSFVQVFLLAHLSQGPRMPMTHLFGVLIVQGAVRLSQANIF